MYQHPSIPSFFFFFKVKKGGVKPLTVQPGNSVREMPYFYHLLSLFLKAFPATLFFPLFAVTHEQQFPSKITELLLQVFKFLRTDFVSEEGLQPVLSAQVSSAGYSLVDVNQKCTVLRLSSRRDPQMPI